MRAPYKKNRFIFATTLLALAITSSPHALIVADELLYSYDGNLASGSGCRVGSLQSLRAALPRVHRERSIHRAMGCGK